MMFGSSGSGATYPYSSTPTGRHSRYVICPSFPRLSTQAEPDSCWPLQTRYGQELSVVTWYICAVGWLYHELHVWPPFTVMTAPWSAAIRMMSGLSGLIQKRWESSTPAAPRRRDA